MSDSRFAPIPQTRRANQLSSIQSGDLHQVVDAARQIPVISNMGWIVAADSAELDSLIQQAVAGNQPAATALFMRFQERLLRMVRLRVSPWKSQKRQWAPKYLTVICPPASTGQRKNWR